MIHQIKALHNKGNGLSERKIAKQLNISRNTVSKWFCRRKTNVCVKINCDLFLYGNWIKHHAGEKPSNPIIKITTI